MNPGPDQSIQNLVEALIAAMRQVANPLLSDAQALAEARSLVADAKK